ncbi:MAG TPA: hypothetical protein VFZ77_15360, partial [Acidimicrobiales bacterium]
PSKYLGHYVAGNLAARHNIHVHLENSPGTGITATIDLPPTLLTTDTDLADPVTPPHGHRAIPGAAVPEPAEPAESVEPVDAMGAGVPAGAPADPSAAPGRRNGDHERIHWSIPSPPAGPAPATRGPGPAPDPAAPPEPAGRTESGLVRRAARTGPGTTIGADQPSGDLLDALRRHTANLQGTAGPGGPPAPPQPGGDPRGGPAPAVHPAEPAGGSRTGGPRPAIEPPGWKHPPRIAEHRPPAASRDAGLRRFPAPQPLGGPPPAPAAPPPAPAGPVPTAGSTAGGLARRVRGAQLPTAEPLRLHRRPAPQSPASGPGPRAAAPAPPRGTHHGGGPAPAGEPSRSADDVYSFLSSFSAGVRRGLEETTRRPPAGGPPGGEGPLR